MGRRKCLCGKKQPLFGIEGDKRPTCCRKCKTDLMVDIINKKCLCGKKQPSFGLEKDKRATCCKDCKSAEMVDIINKKCSCGKKQPSFGFKTDKRGTCCFECKKDDMVDIISKKCLCGSGIQPSFGFKTDKRATCCSKCKTDKMDNIKSKKCSCGKKEPYFGFEGDKRATCCRECKIANMVDIRTNKCSCGKKQPYWGLKEDKRATCCRECKTDLMVDIKHKRCKADHCNIRASERRYRGYCSRCFFYTFPDEKLTRNYKTKENTIVDHIKQKFPNYDWVHDRRVVDGCSLKRPDLYCDFGSHIVVIEVDEDTHRGYSCEEKRMFTIINDFGVRSTIFIRINPDRYTDEKTNRVIPSPFVMKKDTGKLEVKNKKELNIRLDHLCEMIERYSVEKEYKIFTLEELFFC
ncbi:hypothetical protein N9Q05_01585 [bacterium]|nr:hypothetical protein [bacterium]